MSKALQFLGYKYFRPCYQGQAAHAHTNICKTPNVIALGKQKIALTNQSLAEWSLTYPKSLVVTHNLSSRHSKNIFFMLWSIFLEYLIYYFFLLYLI